MINIVLMIRFSFIKNDLKVFFERFIALSMIFRNFISHKIG